MALATLGLVLTSVGLLVALSLARKYAIKVGALKQALVGRPRRARAKRTTFADRGRKRADGDRSLRKHREIAVLQR